MKALGFLAILTSSLNCLYMGSAQASSACPIAEEKETAFDCPWAGFARDLEPVYTGISDEKKAAKLVSKWLEAFAPDYTKRLETDAKKIGKAKLLWGRSLNFDEGAKAIIIPNPVIDALLARAGVPPRGFGVKTEMAPKVVHAGFEHTYGYLLSNLKTAYGYKRARWVRPDIEKGFGLPEGSISPTPKDGGLLANVSYFAGRIAFRGENDKEALARSILSRMQNVSKAVRGFNFSSLHGRRLKETVTLEGGRTVEIRTDFVPFTAASGDATGGNTELLVYSVRDSAEKLPYILSAFPIAKGFSDGALDSKNLGDDQPVITRYNLFVSGMTDAKGPFKGKREAETF